MGCGQIELARALFGKLRCDEGTLNVDGKPFRLDEHRTGGRRRHRLRAGKPAEHAVPSRADLQEHLDRHSQAPVAALAQARCRARASRQAHRSPQHQDAGNRGSARQSLGRQPAEGRRRQMVDLPAQGADPERADARHGCRRQGGCGEDRPRLARSGRRGHGDLDRAGDGAVAGRPDHGDAQRVRLAGIRQ